MKPSVPETLPGAARVAGKVSGVLKILGYVLLVLGIVSMIGGRSRVRAAGERTELPVRLKAGEEFRAPIKTSARSELLIELKLSRHAGVPDNMIDEALVRETNALNIGWAVTLNGATNFAGSSTNARKFFTGSAAAKTKGIGQFKPALAGSYEFSAIVRSNLPELERADPRIVIRPHSAFAMNASIGGSVGVFGGGLVALVGLVLILLARREQSSGPSVS